ncbi:unnamed protein product, partial [Closterium sp. NIES-54]
MPCVTVSQERVLLPRPDQRLQSAQAADVACQPGRASHLPPHRFPAGQLPPLLSPSPHCIAMAPELESTTTSPSFTCPMCVSLPLPLLSPLYPFSHSFPLSPIQPNRDWTWLKSSSHRSAGTTESTTNSPSSPPPLCVPLLTVPPLPFPPLPNPAQQGHGSRAPHITLQGPPNRPPTRLPRRLPCASLSSLSPLYPSPLFPIQPNRDMARELLTSLCRDHRIDHQLAFLAASLVRPSPHCSPSTLSPSSQSSLTGTWLECSSHRSAGTTTSTTNSPSSPPPLCVPLLTVPPLPFPPLPNPAQQGHGSRAPHIALQGPPNRPPTRLPRRLPCASLSSLSPLYPFPLFPMQPNRDMARELLTSLCRDHRIDHQLAFLASSSVSARGLVRAFAKAASVVRNLMGTVMGAGDLIVSDHLLRCLWVNFESTQKSSTGLPGVYHPRPSLLLLLPSITPSLSIPHFLLSVLPYVHPFPAHSSALLHTHQLSLDPTGKQASIIQGLLFYASKLLAPPSAHLSCISPPHSIPLPSPSPPSPSLAAKSGGFGKGGAGAGLGVGAQMGIKKFFTKPSVTAGAGAGAGGGGAAAATPGAFGGADGTAAASVKVEQQQHEEGRAKEKAREWEREERVREEVWRAVGWDVSRVLWPMVAFLVWRCRACADTITTGGQKLVFVRLFEILPLAVNHLLPSSSSITSNSSSTPKAAATAAATNTTLPPHPTAPGLFRVPSMGCDGKLSLFPLPASSPENPNLLLERSIGQTWGGGSAGVRTAWFGDGGMGGGGAGGREEEADWVADVAACVTVKDGSILHRWVDASATVLKALQVTWSLISGNHIRECNKSGDGKSSNSRTGGRRGGGIWGRWKWAVLLRDFCSCLIAGIKLSVGVSLSQEQKERLLAAAQHAVSLVSASDAEPPPKQPLPNLRVPSVDGGMVDGEEGEEEGGREGIEDLIYLFSEDEEEERGKEQGERRGEDEESRGRKGEERVGWDEIEEVGSGMGAGGMDATGVKAVKQELKGEEEKERAGDASMEELAEEAMEEDEEEYEEEEEEGEEEEEEEEMGEEDEEEDEVPIGQLKRGSEGGAAEAETPSGEGAFAKSAPSFPFSAGAASSSSHAASPFSSLLSSQAAKQRRRNTLEKYLRTQVASATGAGAAAGATAAAGTAAASTAAAGTAAAGTAAAGTAAAGTAGAGMGKSSAGSRLGAGGVIFKKPRSLLSRKPGVMKGAGRGGKLSAIRELHKAEVEQRNSALGDVQRQIRERQLAERLKQQQGQQQQGGAGGGGAAMDPFAFTVEPSSGSSLSGAGLPGAGLSGAGLSGKAPVPSAAVRSAAAAAAAAATAGAAKAKTAVLLEVFADDDLDAELEREAAKARRPGGKLSIGGLEGMNRVADQIKRHQTIALGSDRTGPAGLAGRLGIQDWMAWKKPPLPKLDDWFRKILAMDYYEVVSGSEPAGSASRGLVRVPDEFGSVAEYVRVFQPLVLEEFKAQLRRSYEDAVGSGGGGGAGGMGGAGGAGGGGGVGGGAGERRGGAEVAYVGALRMLSIERVDDFQLARFMAEPGASSGSRAFCGENDLVLLTRKVPDHAAAAAAAAGSGAAVAAQQLHVLAK